VRGTLWAIWLSVPDPFSKPKLSFRNSTCRKNLHSRCRFTLEPPHAARSSPPNFRRGSVCNRHDDRIDRLNIGKFRFSLVWQKANVRATPHARVHPRRFSFNGKPQATVGLDWQPPRASQKSSSGQ
jgi:hypothetical protein